MDIATCKAIFTNCIDWIIGLNYILVLIIICSIIVTGVFFERVLYLRKTHVDTGALIIRLRKAIQQGNIAQGIAVCDEVEGAAASIIKAGLCKYEYSRSHIENAMQIRSSLEIAEMEKNTHILAIIASIAPLIGLLGTVIGFIRAFAEMRMSSLVEISATQIGQALEYALVTTAAGLVVAIPSVIAYNYLVHKISSMTIHIQAIATEVVDLIIEGQEQHP